MVLGGGAARPARRSFRGSWLHGAAALRVRHLGAHPAPARRPHQGDRAPERVPPPVHPREPAPEGGRPHRGLRPAGRLGDPRGQPGARGASRDPADERSDHRLDVREVDRVVPGPAGAHQPVGEHRALGDGDPALPAHRRVPVAGGAHRARDRRGGAGGSPAHARGLPRLRRDGPGHARLRRTEERDREVRGRRHDVQHRGPDEGRLRVAGRHLPQPRAALREGLRHHLPGRTGEAAVRVADLVGA